MVTNLINFIDNDFFKLFFVLLSIAVLFVFIKNYFEKRKLEKRIFFSPAHVVRAGEGLRATALREGRPPPCAL